jgi:hypothetical protein
MYGTRFRRRGGSRPESTLGGRSRRLLLRPAAYAILATAVCLAAATLPSGGKSDAANAAAGPVGSGFTVTPADLAFILKQIKIAERHSRAFQGNPDPGTPVNPDPIESDLRPVEVDSLRTGLADAPRPLLTVGSLKTHLRDTRQGRELWLLFLMGAAIFLAAELALGSARIVAP